MGTTNNDVPSLLRSIRVVRRFRPQAVEEAVIRELLDVARWTGSAKNRQPWRFVVVTDENMRQALAECSVRRFASPLSDAPLAIVLVQRPDGYEFDMGRVAQAIITTAAALGLGSCPVTLYEEERARALLNVPPDHRCRYSIALGYPDEVEEQALREHVPNFLPRARLPLEALIHRGTFHPEQEDER